MSGTEAAPNIPEGFGTVTPWIISRDSAELIDFLAKAFDAHEREGSRMTNPQGQIEHVEVTIGESVVMLFDAHATWPKTPAFFRLYVEDADRTYRRAVEAGAVPVTEVTELFWGDRIARVRDPMGNIWWLQSHARDVAPGEMATAMARPEMVKAMKYVQRSLADELDSQEK